MFPSGTGFKSTNPKRCSCGRHVWKLLNYIKINFHICIFNISVIYNLSFDSIVCYLYHLKGHRPICYSLDYYVLRYRLSLLIFHLSSAIFNEFIMRSDDIYYWRFIFLLCRGKTGLTYYYCHVVRFSGCPFLLAVVRIE